MLFRSLGVYRGARTTTVRVAGYDVPRYQTWGVRRFELVRTVTAPRAGRGVVLDTRHDADGDRLIGVLTTRGGDVVAASWRGDDQHGQTGYIGQSPGGSTSAGLLVSGGPTTVRLRDTEGRPADGVLLIYAPID